MEEKRDGRPDGGMTQRAEGMSHANAPRYATLMLLSAAPVSGTSRGGQSSVPIQTIGGVRAGKPSETRL